MTEREAYVAFNLTDQIGSVGVDELVQISGDVVAAWETYPRKIARSGGEIDVAGEFAKAEKFGVEIVTPADEGYPERLKATRGHPLVLYVKGSVKALSMPGVAIVGTRRATTYGHDQANRFGYELAEKGWCVISGLALGIDAEAHRGALDAGGITVGVIGSGLDRFYPEENRELAREIVRKGGAVVSEFPFGREPDSKTFPQRNHVVAALARGVLAVEAPMKSGTLITTGIAADIGRTVMAVPGRVDSRMSAGCLWLIRNGATLVRNAADVEEALSELIPREFKAKAKEAKRESEAKVEPKAVEGKPPVSKVPEMPAMSLEESIVMKHVDLEGVSFDRLVDLTGFDPGKINSLVMTLRLKGRVRFLPGNRVALPRER